VNFTICLLSSICCISRNFLSSLSFIIRTSFNSLSSAAFSESTKMEMSPDSSQTTYEMEIRPVSLLSFAWAQTPHMVKIITVALI
jgi:hypothetical protein